MSNRGAWFAQRPTKHNTMKEEEKYYIVTHEWNEGEELRPNFPKYHINAYVGDYEYCRHAEECMEKCSPYDYCDSAWFETNDEFSDDLEHWIERGCQVVVRYEDRNYQEIYNEYEVH